MRIGMLHLYASVYVCISGTWELRSCIVRSIAYWIDFLYYFMSCQAAIHARIVLQYLDLLAFSQFCRYAPLYATIKQSLSEVIWRTDVNAREAGTSSDVSLMHDLIRTLFPYTWMSVNMSGLSSGTLSLLACRQRQACELCIVFPSSCSALQSCLILRLLGCSGVSWVEIHFDIILPHTEAMVNKRMGHKHSIFSICTHLHSFIRDISLHGS